MFFDLFKTIFLHWDFDYYNNIIFEAKFEVFINENKNRKNQNGDFASENPHFGV